MSESFNTPEEAIEAWDAWLSRYKRPDRSLFLENNTCNSCGSFVVKDGKFNMCSDKDMFAVSQMFKDGTFSIGWPLMPIFWKNLFKDPELKHIIRLSSRWCALFENVLDFREQISQLIINNDRKNDLLNEKLNKWNLYLKNNGFESFQTNDLRGICLAGLDLSGKPYEGINLAHVDMSFSELSVASMSGAYMYGAKLDYAHAFFADMSFSIMHHLKLDYGMFSNSLLCCSSLFNSSLTNTSFFSCNLDGIQLQQVNINGSDFTDATFDTYLDINNGEKKRTKIEKVTGDNETRADFNFTNEQKNSILSKFWNAIDIKPGCGGISFDIKGFFKKQN